MQLVQIGKIGKPHGFRGAFVTQDDAGQDSVLGAIAEVYVGPSAEKTTPYPIEEACWMPRGWKVKLKGLESDTQVKALWGSLIFADRAALPAPQADEYYAGDLAGLAVRETETGKPLGTFEAVEPGQMGGVDRWWIRDGARTFAVPAKKRFIERVDLESRTLWLRNLGELK